MCPHAWCADASCNACTLAITHRQVRCAARTELAMPEAEGPFVSEHAGCARLNLAGSLEGCLAICVRETQTNLYCCESKHAMRGVADITTVKSKLRSLCQHGYKIHMRVLVARTHRTYNINNNTYTKASVCLNDMLPSVTVYLRNRSAQLCISTRLQ